MRQNIQFTKGVTPKEKEKYTYLINGLRNLVADAFNNTDE